MSGMNTQKKRHLIRSLSVILLMMCVFTLVTRLWPILFLMKAVRPKIRLLSGEQIVLLLLSLCLRPAFGQIAPLRTDNPCLLQSKNTGMFPLLQPSIVLVN